MHDFNLLKNPDVTSLGCGTGYPVREHEIHFISRRGSSFPSAFQKAPKIPPKGLKAVDNKSDVWFIAKKLI
jgi:hypothetical protein